MGPDDATQATLTTLEAVAQQAVLRPLADDNSPPKTLLTFHSVGSPRH